jgi:Tfp pilus assembly protein PilX
MNFKMLNKKNSQKGMALILAIGFLAVLSILGAVVLQVSTRDMKASAGFEPRRQAFYVADRAVEYAFRCNR